MILYREIGSESGQARACADDANWNRTYTRHWRVITDDPQIGPKAVKDACPVGIGQTYRTATEDDENSYCISRTVAEDTQANDGRQWIVTVEYGPGNPLEFQPQDPMIERPSIAFSSTRFQVPAYFDWQNNPVVNSAGDPFQKPYMLDQARPFMSIKRNERAFPPLLASDYHNCINTGLWFGMPPFTWKCLSITGDEQQDQNGARYWSVSYEFELNRDTWFVDLLDEGMREIVAGFKVKIRDKDGREIDDPWPLKPNGSKKAAGEKASAKRFHMYREVDFTPLNLDAFYLDLVTSGLLI